MNETDFSLKRLFRAASRAPEYIPAEAPFALETRVLAAWRHYPTDDHFPMLTVVRWASLCACVIIVITSALTFHSLTQPPPSELVVLDSVIQLTLMQ